MNRTIIPDFNLPTEIYIRQDITRSLSEIIARPGTRAILISTSGDFETYYEKALQINETMKRGGSGCIIYDALPGEPNTEDIDLAVAFAKKTNCNMIIGFGGLESLNASKAVALLINNFIFCDDLFSGAEARNEPLKLVTIPAFPVFGLEIAPLFYINEIHEGTKKIFFDRRLYPSATIVDPSLSMLVNETVIMRGMIASLSMAAESVISKGNNDIINTFALKSIDMIFRHLPLVYKESGNPNPRIHLSTASVMSGIAFSVAYLSTTLAISLALAARSDLDVATSMGIILPHIMEFNLTSSPGKYVQMSKVMGEDVRDITVIEAAIKAVEGIRKLELDVDIPQRLSAFNIQKSDFKAISGIAMSYPFLENAPRPLNPDEIETILIAAY